VRPPRAAGPAAKYARVGLDVRPHASARRQAPGARLGDLNRYLGHPLSRRRLGFGAERRGRQHQGGRPLDAAISHGRGWPHRSWPSGLRRWFVDHSRAGAGAAGQIQQQAAGLPPSGPAARWQPNHATPEANADAGVGRRRTAAGRIAPLRWLRSSSAACTKGLDHGGRSSAPRGRPNENRPCWSQQPGLRISAPPGRGRFIRLGGGPLARRKPGPSH